MINLKKIKNFYFLGIGGIGMSAIARYFNYVGNNVAGYDKIKTNLTIEMQKESIIINYTDNIFNIPKWINCENSLVIYTSALNIKNNKQFIFFKKNFFYIKKRSEVLGMITKNKFCISIAGTHGKTTTCALLNHILYKSSLNVISFIGGITKNYKSNFVHNKNNNLKKEKIIVVEADEFDYSFLKLYPNIICITSMDYDHIDIYKNKKILINNYKKFLNNLKYNGKFFINKKFSNYINGGITYSVLSKADYYSDNICIENEKIYFDFHAYDKIYKHLYLPIPGIHNLENTTAALAIAIEMKICINKIIESLYSFIGIERRFSIEHKSNKKVYIDDYAHHPTEINSLINAVKENFYNKKVLGIFQPHLFTRTKYFIEDFAISLAKFDSIIILDIYPSREKSIKGITSNLLFNKIKLKEKYLCCKNINVLNKIKKLEFDVIITIGAGNIDRLIQPIKYWLDNKYFID